MPTEPADVASLLARLSAAEAELRATRTELERATRLAGIGEAGSVLVHELNQPLLVIAGYAEMRRENLLPADGGDRAWEAVGRAADRAALLVRTLHAAASVRIGLVGQVRPEEAVALALALTGEAGRVLVSGDARAVRGSLPRLAIAIAALVDNAARAAPGTVEVALRDVGDTVTIQVSDRGPGVPEDRLWRPLASERPGAAGLGLPVASRIARDHGGELIATPRSGGGAVFRLELPANGPA